VTPYIIFFTQTFPATLPIFIIFENPAVFCREARKKDLEAISE